MRLLLFLFIGVVSLPILLFSHDIPNKGFEQWDGVNPVGWTTSNTEFGVNVERVEDKHEGSYAVKGSVLSLQGFAIPPSLVTGDDANPYVMDEQYVSFTGWYKFKSLGSTFSIIAATYIPHPDSNEVVAGGAFNATESVDVWKQFSFDLFYYPPQRTPQSATIMASIAFGTAVIGEEFYLDDLNWSMTPTSVDKQLAAAKSFSLEQNYPNPFNPNTNIVFSIPEAGNVTLKVYDILGNEVQTLVNGELTEGKYRADFNGENLASGTYIYKLTTDKFTEAKTMMLIK